MTKVNYQPTSPYYKTPQTSWYLSNYEPREIPRDGTDVIKVLETKYQNRPDLLAYDLYGSSQYWWVFMVVNPDLFKDPIWDFKAGVAFYVPTVSRLTSILGS